MPFLHDLAQQESELLFVVSGLCLHEILAEALFAQGKKRLGRHSAASRANQENVSVFHARVGMSPSPWIYLRAHCCSNVTKRADAMLSTRLISHISLTQIIALQEDGWVADCVGRVLFAEPASCCQCEIWPRRTTV